MMLKGREDRDGGEVFRLVWDAMLPYDRLCRLKEPADIIECAASEPKAPVTVRKDFKDQFDSELRKAAGCLTVKSTNGLPILEMIASRVGAEEKVTADILGYFASPWRENDERMVKVFFNLHNMLRTFLSNSLRMLEEEWIMPELRK